MSGWLLESIGYLGSVLVAISLMMANVKHLRWINLFGAAIFSFYGFLIEAWPVFALNGWISLVNIWYLWRMFQRRELFEIIEVSQGLADPVVQMVLTHYEKDINSLFPEIEVSKLTEGTVWITYRDLHPAGIFIFREMPDRPNTTHIILDYAAPEYRDMQNAHRIFSRQLERLNGRGTHMLTATGTLKGHVDYLTTIGFVSVNDPAVFHRVIGGGSDISST